MRRSTALGTSQRSKQVDEIIAKTPGWRGKTLAKLRPTIHDADPDMTEDAKWKRPSNPLGTAVFEHDGLVCMLPVLKSSVRLKFVEGASLPDPKKLFNAELEGAHSRAIDIFEEDTVNEAAVKALVKAAVKQNAAKAKTAKRR